MGRPSGLLRDSNGHHRPLHFGAASAAGEKIMGVEGEGRGLMWKGVCGFEIGRGDLAYEVGGKTQAGLWRSDRSAVGSCINVRGLGFLSGM